MSKKKNTNPMAKAPLPVAAPKKAAARKPKAKVNSQLKTTILSAPRSMKLDAAQSFMRTTAFTLQNKVRTAMTELSKVEKSSKTPSARLGLSYDSSIQPTSSSSFFSNPFNRFKIAFLTVALVGGIGGYFYSDRVIDGFKSLGDAVSNVSSEKTWVEGMMTQTNGIPDDEKDGTLMPPRMMEETVLPVADEVPAVDAGATDVLPTEPVPAPAAAMPAPPVAAPVAKAVAPEVKTPKATKAKAKSKAKVAKAKTKTKAKAKKSAQK
jgi:hypothetical protein